MKQINATGHLVAEHDISSLRQAPQAQPTPNRDYGLGTVFIAGQMKYNPIVSGIRKMTLAAGEQDVEGYSPFDDPMQLAGYPLELFSHSYSPQETMRIKKEYDEQAYLQRASEESGFMGVASSVVGAAMNPLYLVPYLSVGHKARGLIGAADAAAGEALTESLFQIGDLDQHRTMSESLFNITAGAVAGGILRQALGGGNFNAAERKQIESNLKKELEFVGPVQPTGSGNLDDFAEVDQIKGWMSRQAAKLTPLRVLASPNGNARKLGALLGEQHVVGTGRHAVETAVKHYDRFLGKGIEGYRKTYKDYRGREDAPIKIDDYNLEVMRALRNGDTHTIPEVQHAARVLRREILDPVRKEAASVGIYPSDENIARFAQSYAPRMYNFDKITANLAEFKSDLKKWLRSEDPNLMEQELDLAVTEISNNIRSRYNGTDVFTAHGEISVPSLKERKVFVPDNVLEKYLINDPEYILKAWSHNLANKIEMTRMFGDVSFDDLMKQVDDEWSDIISKASEESPALATKLEKKRRDDLEVLPALYDRLQNRYKTPDNDMSVLVRMGRFMRNLNVLRLLGGMQLSAFPDLARPLYRHGLITYAKAIHGIAFNPEFRKMTAAEAGRAGAAMEMVLNQRMMSVSELEYRPTMRHGGYVGAMEYGVQRMSLGRAGSNMDFGRVSLMTPWNQTLKLLTFAMGQDGLLRKAAKRHKYANDFRLAGIDDDMAKRIHEQFVKHGEEHNGLKLSNSDKWDDAQAAEALEMALLKEVDGTIVTPGIMDKPLWMSSEMGKTIGQFKSFGFAATNKQYLAGANNFNGMFVQGTLAAVALGAATWSLKRKIAGYDDTDISNEELLLRGIEYSGVIGFGSELINFGSGALNAAGLYKGDGNFRWARQGLESSLIGPSGGLMFDSFRAVRTFSKEEPNEGDVEALRRLLPYNNLYYVRNLFDAAEETLKSEVGAL